MQKLIDIYREVGKSVTKNTKKYIHDLKVELKKSEDFIEENYEYSMRALKEEHNRELQEVNSNINNIQIETVGERDKIIENLTNTFNENVEKNNDVLRAEQYSFNAKFTLLYYEEQFEKIQDYEEFKNYKKKKQEIEKMFLENPFLEFMFLLKRQK